MPDSTPRLGISIPDDVEADDVPAVLMLAFSQMEKAGVPKVATTAERNAKFGGDDEGSVVITTAPFAIWMKTASATWEPIWSQGTWSYVTLQGGWTNVTTGNRLAWKRVANTVYWRGVLRIPSDYVSGTWIPICNVPADARPVSGVQRFPCSGGSVNGTFSLMIDDGTLQGYISNAGSGSWISVPPPYQAV